MVESTWDKGPVVARHPSLSKLRKVKMKSRKTTYWRKQDHGNEFLATVEAIYHFCDQFQQAKLAAASTASASSHSSEMEKPLQFDDMLLIYASMHARISRASDREPTIWHPSKGLIDGKEDQ